MQNVRLIYYIIYNCLSFQLNISFLLIYTHTHTHHLYITKDLIMYIFWYVWEIKIIIMIIISFCDIYNFIFSVIWKLFIFIHIHTCFLFLFFFLFFNIIINCINIYNKKNIYDNMPTYWYRFTRYVLI